MDLYTDQDIGNIDTKATTSFDLGSLDLKNQPLRYSYPKAEIYTPFFIVALFWVCAACIGYITWTTPSFVLGVLGVCIFGMGLQPIISYRLNSKVSYVVDDLFVIKYFGQKEKWRIPILSITGMSAGIKPATRHTSAQPRGYMLKAGGKVYKITYDLTGAISLVKRLKMVNPGIVYYENQYGIFDRFKGTKLTREYFWQNIWKDILIIGGVVAVIVVVVILLINGVIKVPA